MLLLGGVLQVRINTTYPMTTGKVAVTADGVAVSGGSNAAGSNIVTVDLDNDAVMIDVQVRTGKKTETLICRVFRSRCAVRITGERPSCESLLTLCCAGCVRLAHRARLCQVHRQRDQAPAGPGPTDLLRPDRKPARGVPGRPALPEVRDQALQVPAMRR